MVLLVFFRKDYAIGLILGLPFWLSTAEVAIGETAVMIVGYIFFMLIKRRKNIYTNIRANQNLEFKW